MRALRLLFASSLVTLSLLAAPACATSNSTDQSDLWYIAAESGWGIQFVQRGNLIFFTMFVYDPAGNPIWYVGTIYPTATSLVWSGTMYLTHGPWFGLQPYDPALFGGRAVGTLTWNGTLITHGTLMYSVDGVAVTKAIVRQTLVNENYSGTYVGAVHQTTVGCFDPAFNGTAEFFAGLSVIQNGTSVNLSTASEAGATCSFAGQLVQDGQFGRMDGAYSCASGEVGNFGMFEMYVDFNALRGRFTANSTNNGCQSTGYLGGIRHR